MPPETQTPVQQADHTLAEPAYLLILHLVVGNDLQMMHNMEDFLYFLICTTDMDAQTLINAINEFTTTKEG